MKYEQFPYFTEIILSPVLSFGELWFLGILWIQFCCNRKALGYLFTCVNFQSHPISYRTDLFLNFQGLMDRGQFFLCLFNGHE